MFTRGFEKVASPMAFMNAVRKGTLSPVGRSLMKSHAATGAVTGAGLGFMNAEEGQGLSGALKGALMGGAAGAASGGVQAGMARNQVAGSLRQLRKTPGVGRSGARLARPGLVAPVTPQPLGA